MAGTRAGGLRAAATLKKKDPDHFAKIGGKGGRNGTGAVKGFARDPKLARLAGKKAFQLKKGNKK